jgi:4'-phosphopantetheinyl transferase
MMPQLVLPYSECPGVDRLETDEVHLWYVAGEDIDDEGFIATTEQTLSNAERERALRFHRKKDRHRFVIGRGMLRWGLSAYYGKRPDEIIFSQNRYGRPEVVAAERPTLRFNASHTDGFVGVVFASGCEVGVDAERIYDFAYLELAKRYFSSHLYEELRRLPASFACTLFFEYWVALEAYAKAKGIGLSLSFVNVDVEFGSPEYPARSSPDKVTAAERWSFWLLEPTPVHRLAVAVSQTNRRLLIHRLRSTGVEAVQFPILAHGRIGDCRGEECDL